ncbi:armadillo repeat-containing protein [Tieghemostelium lacteum]|uniref:Armadillo repeat-containing protein n=1 Tax=Tieghemostelium lacteum TaxID=361077 RepID=A0A152AA87_TIELA|nr:armadillo repeat-containing protein [Tieghemostelium lacteum]|eukprot:KYR03136.1 armadillo repeat-containing protein [Tieghemostelium lacteum]
MTTPFHFDLKKNKKDLNKFLDSLHKTKEPDQIDDNDGKIVIEQISLPKEKSKFIEINLNSSNTIDFKQLLIDSNQYDTNTITSKNNNNNNNNRNVNRFHSLINELERKYMDETWDEEDEEDEEDDEDDEDDEDKDDEDKDEMVI